MTGRLNFAFFMMGLAALVGQLILIRELLVVFQGNELSAAIVLAAWLLWTGIGSAGPGRLADGFLRKQRLLGLIQLTLAILLPLSILVIRLSGILWKIPVGEVVDPGKMVLISFTILSPFCCLSGFLFALGCSLHHEKSGAYGQSAGTVYLWEALGAGLGGLLFSFFFIHYLNHLQTSFLVSMFLVLSALFLLVSDSGSKRNRALIRVFGLAGIGFWTLLTVGGDKLELISRGWGWPEYRLLETKDTPYGNLTVVTADSQVSFFENGLWIFTHPDRQTAEGAVHLAMLEHARPEKVLLIGGGISGALTEILKHPSVTGVDYIELDPEIIAMGRRLLAPSATRALSDPRVRIINTDGRKFIKTVEAGYDVIIINLPDPTTAQVNRFYTVDFFREVRRIIKPNGIFSFSLTASENIIGPTLAQLLNSIWKSLEVVFEDTLVLPGGSARFFGANGSKTLVAAPRELVERIRDRKLELLYVRDYYLLFNLAAPRRVLFEKTVKAAGEARINLDLLPACFYYGLLHWSSQYKPGLKKAYYYLGRIKYQGLIIAVIFLSLPVFYLSRPGTKARRLRPALIYAGLITGFSEMMLTVLVIVSFQILYGYVYQRLALLITAYMVGLILGSRQITSRLGGIEKPFLMLLYIQAGLVIYPLILMAVLNFVHIRSPLAPIYGLIENCFPLLPLIAGYLGGLHFPLTNSLYLGQGGGVGRSGGLIYGLDLVGSAIGAFAAGAVLLPVWGIPAAIYLVTVLNLLAVGLFLVLFLLNGKKSRTGAVKENSP